MFSSLSFEIALLHRSKQRITSGIHVLNPCVQSRSMFWNVLYSLGTAKFEYTEELRL